MKVSTRYFSPDDYDRHGVLRLPIWFWGVLILQARTWILLVIAGASSQQGEGLLRIFYPDRESFWFGMLMGLPAVLAFLLCGRRQRWPRCWQASYWVLLVAGLAALAGVLYSLWQQGEDAAGLGILLALLDVLALVYLWRSPRLRACFAPWAAQA
ncbi:hypothetical protein BIY27_10005 [Gibbsiella quercinecans]|uniref:DUF2919 domain-containing protein n=1 Tax=Gibbsiella quercinecans TaxID=929813 RepID=UPI000EF241D0|nr:DUF2919 domain-containing protein [Gibbsiella quercinecans]RLM13599.1 hypothetical protein BIY27_10005 [Gibbsiella quercinecans]